MAQTQTTAVPPSTPAGGIGREPTRQPMRSMERMFTAPEPHEKYEILPGEFPPNMDLLWLPTVVAGMENKRAVMDSFRAGWMPAAASDFPRISGYGHDMPAALLDAGLVDNVKADDAVVIDGQMLVMRPKELSRRAHEQREKQASSQVQTQMRRLRQVSRAFRGTEVRRNHAPMPDSGRENENYVDEE